jgi:UDP-glucoronosyl and UDP-glucosyl transferase
MTRSHAQPPRWRHVLTVGVFAAACAALPCVKGHDAPPPPGTAFVNWYPRGGKNYTLSGVLRVPHNAFVEWAPSPRCADITACTVPPPAVPPAAVGLRYLYLLSHLDGSHALVHRRLGLELVSRGARVLALHPDDRPVKSVADPDTAFHFTTISYKSNWTATRISHIWMLTRFERALASMFTWLHIEKRLLDAGLLAESLATECDALLADADALHKVAQFQPDFVVGDRMDHCVPILSERLGVARAEVSVGAFQPALSLGTQWGTDWALDVDRHTVPTMYGSRMPPRTIIGAFQNVAAHALHAVLDRLLVAPHTRRLHVKHGVDLTSPAARARAALLVINADPAWEHTQSLPPGVVLAGSIMAGPGDPLPPDLAAWTAAAAARGDRVVYCAMGSFFKLLPEQADALVSGLASLPSVSLLIKLSADEMDDAAVAAQPSNVRVVRWAPQNDLLASGALSLFVTHGGSGSIGEAVYHGVPLAVMPLESDQLANAVKVAAAGFGVASLGFRPHHASITSAVSAAMSDIDTLTARARAAQARARVARPTGAAVAAAAIERAALLGLGARAPLLRDVDGGVRTGLGW